MTMSCFLKLPFGSFLMSRNVLHHRAHNSMVLDSSKCTFARYAPLQINCDRQRSLLSTDSNSNLGEHRQPKRRKAPIAKTSLRRAAVEAQRTKDSMTNNAPFDPTTKSEVKVSQTSYKHHFVSTSQAAIMNTKVEKSFLSWSHCNVERPYIIAIYDLSFLLLVLSAIG